MASVRGGLVALMAALLLLPSAHAVLAVDADARLVGIEPLDLDVTVARDELVEVGVESPFLPPLDVSVAGIKAKTGPQGAAGDDAAPSPVAPPAPTPPDLPTAAATVAAQGAGVAALGAVATTSAMPLDALASKMGQWLAQVRDSARPGARSLRRFLAALPFLAPLFARIGGERLLENPVRAKVHTVVSTEPGISLQEVRDRAGVAWGTTVHHLARLERHGLVVSVRHGNHRRYFPANSSSSRHRREIAALAHPTAQRIASHVTAFPGTDQKGLCTALGLQNPAASKHLGRFDRLGLVQVETVGRSRLYHPTPLLEGVLAALAELGPLHAEERAPRLVAQPSPIDGLEAIPAPPPASSHLPLVDPLGATARDAREYAVPSA